MKILWVTKIASPSLTGGTRVSSQYRQALEKSSTVDLIALYQHNVKLFSRWRFFKQLLQVRSNHYDAVFFDDHYAIFAPLFRNHNTLQFYHGNWPKLMFASLIYFLKGLYLFPQYLMGFVFCRKVIFVNPYFEKLLGFLCRSTLTLINPVTNVWHEEYAAVDPKEATLVAVGNIDRRKYNLLLLYLNQGKELKRWQIDIYGKIVEQSLADELGSFPNVQLKGYVPFVPYHRYAFHISFSSAENLPLSLLESLRNRTRAIYPRAANYRPLFGNTGIQFYNNQEELELFLSAQFSERPQRIADSSAWNFIPTSFEQNLATLKGSI
ncbi:Glycosyltransferase involved in cell wall bisynthesis [Cnuella takakiae]|uniref:Glycosyltransferase involved in cell wall bisynthesis n=1 Tax=Cnuella takakiae TaxID=1302690 RepID=A0A1M5B8L7_9BACT|nr:glycosyltransferase [Cnuella takakiae]OLY93382.1 hypothetical protein BUE76_16960 [Cnuella takakiae]SHF38901.1 Glycosyltransferase involved in cell wall bisynthesis [Cnuella takakiae]